MELQAALQMLMMSMLPARGLVESLPLLAHQLLYDALQLLRVCLSVRFHLIYQAVRLLLSLLFPLRFCKNMLIDRK